ncbi:hypothetical protein [Haloprofundus marisrubri]|uniref:hypothetical protein n=1 Tax=Haloprofundus marisrubri TaxID=1514971 RepID=UPI0012BA7ACF|nr:hypothetical protein [Haloprofundus marisrubri]
MSTTGELKRMLAAVELTVVGVGLCLFFRPDVLLVGVGGLMVLAGVVVVLVDVFPSAENGSGRDHN